MGITRNRRGSALVVMALTWAAVLGALACRAVSPEPPPAGVVWLDLAAELPHTEAYHFPEYDIDFSSPDSVRYLDDRWLGINPDTRVLESAGPAAAFRIPSIPVPLELEVEIDPHWTPATEPRRVMLAVNGKPGGSFEAPGSTRHRLRIPQALLIDGENVFEVTCPGASSFAVTAFRTAPAAERGRFPRGSVAVREGRQPRILQVPGAHVSFSVRPPPGARLAFRAPAHGWPLARYRVTAEADGSPAEVLFSQVVVLGRDVVLPLDRFADRPVRLSFELRLRGGSSAAPLAWEAPRIVGPAPPKANPPSPAPQASGAAQRPPNIVIYVLDALRADHLEPYGYPRDTSPRIVALAREAVLFENAFANSVWTKASVGSLLTGLLPADHGAATDVARLSPSAKLLSSYLKRNGYTCLALQANSNAGRSWGFDADFDVFLEEEALRDARKATWDSSERIHDAVLGLADRLKPPFFLFIQSVDTHFPYDPHGEFRRYVQGHPLDGQPVGQVFDRWRGRPAGSPENHRETSYLVGLYDGSIRHNDALFGKLVDFLKAKNLYDSSVVLLTADHGEAFKDHGFEVAHGVFYQHTVRVPLILKLSDGSMAGRRSRVPVQHLDVVPTVLQMAGVESGPLPGRSLLESISEEAAALPRSIHVLRYRDREIPRFPRDGRGVISWPWKLIQENAWRPRYEIYDLESDPLETNNVWDGASPLSVRVRFLLQELRRLPATLSGSVERTLTDEDRENLRALGYIR